MNMCILVGSFARYEEKHNIKTRVHMQSYRSTWVRSSRMPLLRLFRLYAKFIAYPDEEMHRSQRPNTVGT